MADDLAEKINKLCAGRPVPEVVNALSTVLATAGLHAIPKEVRHLAVAALVELVAKKAALIAINKPDLLVKPNTETILTKQ